MLKNKAFTFVEIIVTITIIALISSSWVFYFHDFIWKQEISIHINNFQNKISELNNDVKKHNTFDYIINFDKNSHWYTISENNIWTDYLQDVQFDTISNNWSVSVLPATNDIWEIKIYSWNKKIDEITRNWTDVINIDINKDTKINWVLSWSTLNNISFNFFNNIDYSKTKNIYILDILDNTMTSYNSLTIENINWNIRYLHNSNELTKPIIILFEKNWIEDRLELN
jgi:prepilin-type N-terminal cleavage/methylation domain-containing protein